MPIEEKIRRFARRHPFTVPRVSLAELENACRAYEEGDWDSIYRIAMTLVQEGWTNQPNIGKVVDGLNVLLRIWNQQFYGPSSFDEPEMEQWLVGNWQQVDSFRGRDISSLVQQDDEEIERIFDELLHPLRKTSEGTKSPVSVAKALHLLAPSFFPLWDGDIAWKWECPFSTLPAMAYIIFCQRIRQCAQALNQELEADNSPHEWLRRKTLIKRIDEYNYMNKKRSWCSLSLYEAWFLFVVVPKRSKQRRSRGYILELSIVASASPMAPDNAWDSARNTV